MEVEETKTPNQQQHDTRGRGGAGKREQTDPEVPPLPVRGVWMVFGCVSGVFAVFSVFVFVWCVVARRVELEKRKGKNDRQRQRGTRRRQQQRRSQPNKQQPNNNNNNTTHTRQQRPYTEAYRSSVCSSLPRLVSPCRCCGFSPFVLEFLSSLDSPSPRRNPPKSPSSQPTEAK